MHCIINIRLTTPKAGYKKEIRFIKPIWDIGIVMRIIINIDFL